MYLYTIGATFTYDQPHVTKAKGGSVWRNIKAVREHLKAIHGHVQINQKNVPAAIYLLSGDWDKDVIPESNTYGYLKNPCPVKGKII